MVVIFLVSHSLSCRFLRVASNNLTGALPSSCSAWSALQYLDVSGNLLSSTLPSTLQELTNLWYLDVSQQFDPRDRTAIAGFSGTLPATLANLTALQYDDDTNTRNSDCVAAISSGHDGDARRAGMLLMLLMLLMMAERCGWAPTASVAPFLTRGRSWSSSRT